MPPLADGKWHLREYLGWLHGDLPRWKRSYILKRWSPWVTEIFYCCGKYFSLPFFPCNCLLRPPGGTSTRKDPPFAGKRHSGNMVSPPLAPSRHHNHLLQYLLHLVCFFISWKLNFLYKFNSKYRVLLIYYFKNCPKTLHQNHPLHVHGILTRSTRKISWKIKGRIGSSTWWRREFGGYFSE